jgi:hypothetical protein
MSWAKKHGRKHIIRMFENDCPILFAKFKKSHWIISTSMDNFAIGGQSYVGCIAQNRKSTRFDLCGVDNVPILGVGFYEVVKTCPFRAFRVVVPKPGNRQSSMQGFDLSQLAQNGSADRTRFTVYSSKLPEKAETGQYRLSFGNVYVMKSLKNFIVETENHETVFMIFRSSGGTCSVKVHEPVTLHMAFALAVAAVVGEE